MAYTKHNFENGQVLKAEHLNDMEAGIVNAEPFAFEVPFESGPYPEGVSFSDIQNACELGRTVICRVNQGDAFFDCPLIAAAEGLFMFSVFGDGAIVVMAMESVIAVQMIEMAKAEDIPTELPNPNALTFTGAVSGTYDGSEAKTINIPTIAGPTGERGNSILNITTAPSAYTTATGGFTPAYRIALSTVLSQSKAAKVLVGDSLRYSYYVYPVGYVDASYVYCGTRVSIRGATGAAGAAGTDYVLTDADKTEIAEMVKSEGIPAYWQSALDDGVEAINTALCEAGYNKSAFLFYTDCHWNYGSQRSPSLLKYLYQHTGLTKTFFGGDVVNDESYEYDPMEYLWDWRNQLKDLPNHHSVVGNHDDAGNTAVQFTEQYVYGYMLAAEETCDMVLGDKGLYYYIDSPAEKTRYLCLDTGFKDYSSLSAEQEAFIREALKTTLAGWHIVVVAHVWYAPDYDQYSVVPIPVKGLSSTASSIAGILDSYNNRVGEFAECGAWVEFCIGGHVHRDYDGATPNGIPIVLVETDSHHIRSGLACTAGTTTEASVNGIIADYDAKTIKVVRVGRGSSRNVEMTWYEVNYTNVLPLATAADGVSIYNGTGYKAGVRWSASGNSESTSNASGLYLSGYIPVNKDSVVRLENITMNKINAGSDGCAVHTFLSLTDTNEGTMSGDTLTNYASGIWDETGNLVQFTLNGTVDYAFIRLQGTYMGADSIVTVDEEIGDDPPSENAGYTNILKAVGYTENTRISASSGYAEREQNGVDLTGYIPVIFGDVLRFKNMTIPQTTTGYGNNLYLFDTSKTGIGSGQVTNFIGTGYWTAVWDEGNLVELKYGGDTGFIRINATNIDDTSIITINEEIT